MISITARAEENNIYFEETDCFPEEHCFEDTDPAPEPPDISQTEPSFEEIQVLQTEISQEEPEISSNHLFPGETDSLQTEAFFEETGDQKTEETICLNETESFFEEQDLFPDDPPFEETDELPEGIFAMEEDPVFDEPLFETECLSGSIKVGIVDQRGNDLYGGSFMLVDSNGKGILQWYSGGGPVEIKNLPVGEYKIRTLSAPDGYQVEKDVPIYVENNGSFLHSVSLKESAARVFVRGDAGDLLPYRSGIIQDKKGMEVFSWDYSVNPQVIRSLKKGSYQIRIIPEEGYASPAPFSIECSGNEADASFSIRVSPIRCLFAVRNEDGIMEDGLLMSLKSESSEINWISSKAIMAFSRIPAGNYEVMTDQEGYLVSDENKWVRVEDTAAEQRFEILVRKTD